jgi:hypothetical protein
MHVGAVVRATFNVGETGITATAWNTAGAHARDAEIGAAVGVHRASARFDTASAVITCPGGAGPAAPAAAVVAASVAGRAVTRAAGPVETALTGTAVVVATTLGAGAIAAE